MDFPIENSYPTPYANTTILPLLVLSLMQQKNAPKTKDVFRTEYDFIIVGAGSAGSVVASRLSEVPCVSVLLLEAGKPPPILTDVPALYDHFIMSDISWPYRTVPQKNTARAMVNNQVAYPSGKTLGGSSTINTMWYVRGNRHDYDSWAEQGAKGWSYKDVLPYFLKAEDNPDISNEYHAVDGPLSVSTVTYQSGIRNSVLDAAQQLGYQVVDVNARKQTGFYNPQTTIRNGQRCSTAKAYLVPAENRTNLDIVAKAFVHKVVIEDGRATGVLLDHEGDTFEIKVKREVIVSAGSINSAKLLLLSGIGPKEHLEQLDIPVIVDLPVGENLQDHCGTFELYELNQTLIPNRNQKLENATNIQNYIDNRRGPLSSLMCDPLAFLTLPTNPQFDYPDYEMYNCEWTVPALNPSLPDVINKYFAPYVNSTLYACFSSQLKPKSRGTVRLQSTDPYDPPLIDPKYFEVPEDITPVVEGLKTCRRIATSDPMKKIGTKLFAEPFPGCEDVYGDDDKYFECYTRSSIMTIFHPVGTNKMGTRQDPTTVVDPELRVKGIEGLRVVDASVMPIIPTGNTNAPTIMIAEKASDMIKETLDCYTQIPV